MVLYLKCQEIITNFVVFCSHLKHNFLKRPSFIYLEIMIGGPQPSGGMEGLKSQLKSGSAEGGAEGSNGVTEGESVEGGDDKGTPPIQSFQYFMKRVELIGNLFQ